ncbi:MAG: hypothetical protein LBF56_02530 [Holosporales bacterium]|nr:hypothetical protein [Holosporales bacterium]
MTAVCALSVVGTFDCSAENIAENSAGDIAVNVVKDLVNVGETAAKADTTKVEGNQPTNESATVLPKFDEATGETAAAPAADTPVAEAQKQHKFVAADGTVFTPPEGFVLPPDMKDGWFYVTTDVDAIKNALAGGGSAAGAVGTAVPLAQQTSGAVEGMPVSPDQAQVSAPMVDQFGNPVVAVADQNAVGAGSPYMYQTAQGSVPVGFQGQYGGSGQYSAPYGVPGGGGQYGASGQPGVASGQYGGPGQYSAPYGVPGGGSQYGASGQPGVASGQYGMQQQGFPIYGGQGVGGSALSVLPNQQGAYAHGRQGAHMYRQGTPQQVASSQAQAAGRFSIPATAASPGTPVMADASATSQSNAPMTTTGKRPITLQCVLS